MALLIQGRNITLDVDGLVDFSSDLESPQPVIAAGLEFPAAGSVPIRAGFTHDGAVDWVSGGLGFMTGENVNGGQFSVTFRQNIDDTDNLMWALDSPYLSRAPLAVHRCLTQPNDMERRTQ